MESMRQYKKLASSCRKGNFFTLMLASFTTLFFKYFPFVLIGLYLSTNMGEVFGPSKLLLSFIVLAILVSFVFSTCMDFGFKKMYNALYRSVPVEPLNVFHGFKQAPKVICLKLFIGFAVGIGLALFIFPGVYLLCALAPAPYLLAAEPQKGVVTVIKESFQITSGKRAGIFLYYISYTLWFLVPAVLVGFIVYLTGDSIFAISGSGVNIRLYFAFLSVFYLSLAFVLMIYGGWVKFRIQMPFVKITEQLKNKWDSGENNED